MPAPTMSEMEHMAESAATKAVAQTLTTLGIDVSDPIKAQRDFAVLRELRALVDDEEFQADLKHLRKWRKAVDAVQVRGFVTIVGLIITGLTALVFVGLKDWLVKLVSITPHTLPPGP